MAVRNASWKTPVRVATTAAGTLASSFENGDAIDGVTLATGDRILIKDQAAGAENGIYDVKASGAPSRAFDLDASVKVQGATTRVMEGTANGGSVYACTTTGVIVLGTTALVFATDAAGAGAPTTVDYLVGTADAGLSAEIVVGTSPGGELGGTWAAPTVDATHSGSTHGAAVTTHEGLSDPHTGYRLESADHTHASTGLQAGTVAHSALTGIAATDHHAAPAAGPDANVTVDGAGAAGTASTFARSAHGHQLVTGSGTPAAVTTAGAAGTSGSAPSRGDHAHAHEAGHIAHDTIWDAAGDLAVGSGADTAVRLAKGADGTVLKMAAGAVTWGTDLTGAGSDPVQGAYAPGSFTLVTEKYAVMSKRLQLTTTQRATLAGTSRLRIT